MPSQNPFDLVPVSFHDPVSVLAIMVLALTVGLLPVYSQESKPSGNDGLVGLATHAVPNLVRFSGIAKDGERKPLTGVVGITFALYRVPASPVTK